MLNIPINKKLNSERMLQTGEFQTSKWHNEELIWLVRYMYKKLKKSEDEIFKIWKTFKLKQYPEYDEQDLRKAFNVCKKYSRWVMLDKYTNTFNVYQKEIDYINSLPVVYWVRQYIYILLIHARAIETDVFDYLPFNDYKLWISSSNHNTEEQKETVNKKLKELKIIQNITVEETHDMLPDIDQYGNMVGISNNISIRNQKIKLSLIDVDESETKYTFSSILDALNTIHLINDTYICPECGQEIHLTNKSKRIICDDCWKKDRQKQWRESKKKNSTGNGKT